MEWRGGVAVPIGVALLAGALGAQVPADVAGPWEYRQANAARAEGLDAEGERLVVTRHADGRLTAHYYGLEREGEHGLFYTAVDVGPLDVTPDGALAFRVPARTLFRTRPATLADAARLPSAGRTTDVLVFSGRRAGDTLVLECSSTRGACPDRRLVFRRIAGSAP